MPPLYGEIKKVEIRKPVPVENNRRPRSPEGLEHPRELRPPEFGREIRPRITPREIRGLERIIRPTDIFIGRRFGLSPDRLYRAERAVSLGQRFGLFPQDLSPQERSLLIQALINIPEAPGTIEQIKSQVLEQRDRSTTDRLGYFSLLTSFAATQNERSGPTEEEEQATQTSADLARIIQELCSIPARLAVEFAKMAAQEAEADQLAFKRAEKRLDQERQDLRHLQAKQERLRQEVRILLEEALFYRAQKKPNDLAA